METTLRSYIYGFVLSLALTTTAFYLVASHTSTGALSYQSVIAGIAVLALVQIAVQLHFFLHLGKKTTPRVTAILIAFALLVIIIVVGGSLWIMYNLANGMNHVQDIDAYLHSQN